MFSQFKNDNCYSKNCILLDVQADLRWKIVLRALLSFPCFAPPYPEFSVCAVGNSTYCLLLFSGLWPPQRFQGPSSFSWFIHWWMHIYLCSGLIYFHRSSALIRPDPAVILVDSPYILSPLTISNRQHRLANATCQVSHAGQLSIVKRGKDPGLSLVVIQRDCNYSTLRSLLYIPHLLSPVFKVLAK